MYLKYVFFLILLPLASLSQNFFNIKKNIIYIDANTSEDIVDLDLHNIRPFVYTKIPDLSGLTPSDKKNKFISMILPSILIEKDKLKDIYSHVLNNMDIIEEDKDIQLLYDYCDCIDPNNLLLCLFENPTSVMLAQAAIESGWGTSRFFLEGFNLYGIHSFNIKDNRIQANNTLDDSPVYVKKYPDVLSSISDYLRTLGRVDSYAKYRETRMKSKNVIEMLQYLSKYSERRELYVKDISSIISFNNLTQYDTLKIKW
jgi:Bax protein